MSNSGPLRANSTFNFTITIQWPLPSNACYTLDFGNDEPACIQWGATSDCAFLFPESSFSLCLQSSNSLSFSNGTLLARQEYKLVKAYYPLLYGRNRVSSLSTSSLVVATCGICLAPSVDLHSGQSCIEGVNCDSTNHTILTIYRSVPFVIKSYTINNCECNNILFFNWTFIYYNESSQSWSNFTDTLRQIFISKYGNDSFFWSSFDAKNLPQITIANHTLPYGLYQICLNVSLIGIQGKQDLIKFTVLKKYFKFIHVDTMYDYVVQY